MDVGGDLRRARTARTLSLVDIAARTKINPKILRAIEDNRFDRVPGGLFTRGFLRAYAREVQLDPEDIVERYRAEFGPRFAEAVPSIEETPRDVDIDSLAAPDDGRDSRRGMGLAIVLLIGAAYFVFARSVTTSSSPGTAPKPTDAVEALSPPSATPTTGTLETSNAGPLKFAITATADCWVAGSIDGTAAIARLMKAGEREQFDVHDRAALRIGDPSAFSFTLNGVPGRVVGTAHTAVNLTFDRQSYKSVLREKPL
jgi:cytoskeleton protein RodZ